MLDKLNENLLDVKQKYWKFLDFTETNTIVKKNEYAAMDSLWVG